MSGGSDNVIFTSERELTDALRTSIQQDLEHALGSTVGVFVRTASEVRASAESEPFSAHVSKTKIQVLILDSRPTGHARGRLWP